MPCSAATSHDISQTYDGAGLTSISDTVIVAQASSRTKEMVDAWSLCPIDEQRFPGCLTYAKSGLNEIGAFSEYVRPAVNGPTDLKATPRNNDASGLPGQYSNCSDIFIRQHTSNLSATKAYIEDSLLETFTTVFAKHYDGTKHMI